MGPGKKSGTECKERMIKKKVGTGLLSDSCVRLAYFPTVGSKSQQIPFLMFVYLF